ncbi:MAG: hypothetical protein RL514_2682 [Verrucomicrobiota bacterium]
MTFNNTLARRHFLRATGAALALPLLEFPTHAAGIPQSLTELWADFDPRQEPLEIEVLKAWEQEGVVCRLIRFQVGVFKGAPARVAAFYAFPKGGTKLPALVELHGGGQSASLNSVVTYAKRGYAGISINWGGNKLNFGGAPVTYDGPQTDWGKLDATHPPQRNKANHFAGSLAPDEFTLDAVESPRNSNWFLVLMAARRAITFLEQQPEVDAARIGAHGHSMGGKLTTNLAGIDKRIKAAVRDLIAALAKKEEAGRRLLDNTMVMFGSNLGNANSHESKNLGIVLAGGGFKHAGHVAFDRENNTPLSNLFVTMLQRMNIETDRFGSSRGTVSLGEG